MQPQAAQGPSRKSSGDGASGEGPQHFKGQPLPRARCRNNWEARVDSFRNPSTSMCTNCARDQVGRKRVAMRGETPTPSFNLDHPPRGRRAGPTPPLSIKAAVLLSALKQAHRQSVLLNNFFLLYCSVLADFDAQMSAPPELDGGLFRGCSCLTSSSMSWWCLEIPEADGAKR